MGWFAWARSRRTGKPAGFAVGNGVPGSGPVEVREVRSGRELDQFVQVAWRTNASDPCWVPPLMIEVKEFVDRKKHPFFLHGEAIQFIACQHGVPAGRILVSDDPNYNAFHNSSLGCFGMFESIDDPRVAHALLDAAAGWLRARGRTAMRGPIDFSMNYPSGLLIEGFDTPPRLMMNHNPPYYAGLLESWGLAKAKDLYAWWFDDSQNTLTRWQRLGEWLARRGRISVRPFRRDDFDAEVERCGEVYDAAYKDNWGFVPLSHAEFKYFARQMARIALDDQVLLAEADGQPVGFSVTLPDLNEAIRPLNGRLTTLGLPIGLARFLWRIRKVKSARMLVLVVLQEYRGRGVAELMIMHTLRHGKNTLGYTGAELSWTLEDNYRINRMVEAVGGRRYKTYRIYEMALS